MLHVYSNFSSELSVSKGEWSRRGYASSKPDVLSLEGLEDNVPRVHISVRGLMDGHCS